VSFWTRSDDDEGVEEDFHPGYFFNPDILVNRINLLVRITKELPSSQRQLYLKQAAELVLKSVDMPLSEDMKTHRSIH
jgi:predicted ABC-class ATPase